MLSNWFESLIDLNLGPPFLYTTAQVPSYVFLTPWPTSPFNLRLCPLLQEVFLHFFLLDLGSSCLGSHSTPFIKSTNTYWVISISDTSIRYWRSDTSLLGAQVGQPGSPGRGGLHAQGSYNQFPREAGSLLRPLPLSSLLLLHPYPSHANQQFLRNTACVNSVSDDISVSKTCH